MSSGPWPTVDWFEVAVLALFAVAAAQGALNLLEAWRNELVALDSGDPDVALLGLEDLLRALTKLKLMALPGVVLGVLLMTIPSPLQRPDAPPQELIVAIVLRVVLLLFGAGLCWNTGLSAWLRRRMIARRAAPPPPVVLGEAPAGVAPPGHGGALR